MISHKLHNVKTGNGFTEPAYTGCHLSIVRAHPRLAHALSEGIGMATGCATRSGRNDRAEFGAPRLAMFGTQHPKQRQGFAMSRGMY